MSERGNRVFLEKSTFSKRHRSNRGLKIVNIKDALFGVDTSGKKLFQN